MNEYKGWQISYTSGVWRAIRFGVGLSANSQLALLQMIDHREVAEDYGFFGDFSY